MNKVNLSPDCVDAITELQENADSYAGILECACDYIIECTDTLSDNCKPVEAISSLRQLRELKKLIEKLEGGAA